MGMPSQTLCSERLFFLSHVKSVTFVEQRAVLVITSTPDRMYPEDIYFCGNQLRPYNRYEFDSEVGSSPFPSLFQILTKLEDKDFEKIIV